MNKLQKEFFESLKLLQEDSVVSAICDYCREKNIKDWNDIKINNLNELENILYNATYETIVNFCTLIDGYRYELSSKLDLVDKNNKKSLREGIELHDNCEEFLIYQKLK